MAAIPQSGQSGGIQPGVSALQTTIGYTPPATIDDAAAVGLAAGIQTSAPISLTLAAHNNRTITLNPGATLTVSWALTGTDFGALIINSTGADLLPTLIGFTGSSITNPLGFTALLANGLSALLCASPDGGATRLLRAGGDLT